MQTKNYETPFVCNDNSLIYFGKLKGQTHSVLKEPENVNYCKWILQTEDSFGESTKQYIKTHVKLD